MNPILKYILLGLGIIGYINLSLIDRKAATVLAIAILLLMTCINCL